MTCNEREEQVGNEFDTADFYTCEEDAEELAEICPDDAIEMWLDKFYPDPAPETVTVYAYKRSVVSETVKEWAAEHAIENLIERLDEDYNSGVDSTKPTPEMEKAAREFVEKVVALYKPWNCDPCGEREYDVKKWREENPCG